RSLNHWLAGRVSRRAPEDLLGAPERGADLVRLFAARLREVRPAAAAAADVAGVIAPVELLAHRCDQAHVAFPVAGEHHDSRADFFLELIGDIAQLSGIDAVDLADQNARAVELRALGQKIGDAVFCERAAQFGDFLFQLARALEKLLHFIDRVVGAAADEIADLSKPLFVTVNQIERALAGERFDAAHAGGDAALGLKLEKSDLAGGADVRAA